jgi:hypothetical protein
MAHFGFDVLLVFDEELLEVELAAGTSRGSLTDDCEV